MVELYVIQVCISLSLFDLNNKHTSVMLTLIPLGYFEDLSPLGGGGHFGPPPSDLGN